MIYFLYYETYHEKDSDKGIYHYTLYKDVYTYHINSDHKIVPFLTAADFVMSPIMAAFDFILRKRRFKRYDQIRIMSKDGMVSQIINQNRLHNQCPEFKQFWEGSFKPFQRCAIAFHIYPLMNYDYFKVNPNRLYEREQKRIEEFKKLLSAS